MKGFKIIIMTVGLIIFASLTAYAASDSAAHDVTMQVTEIVIVDLNSTATVTLSTNAPVAGGDAVTGDTDASKLLQYTSLVSSGTNRGVQANMGVGDAVPSGTSLAVAASAVPANCGTAAGSVTLTTSAQDVVTSIQSCATGTGASGTTLTYTYAITDVNSLVVGGGSTVTVTYTLTDAL